MIEVRPARADDADGMANVIFRSQTETYRDFAPQAWLEAQTLATFQRRWRKRMADTAHPVTYVVAIHDETVIGMMGLQPFADWGFYNQATDYAETDDAQVGVLRNAHVLPEHARAGVGTLLYQACLAMARQRGHRVLFADTALGNVRSRRFMEKLGWTQMAVVHNDSIGGDVIYRIQLSSA